MRQSAIYIASRIVPAAITVCALSIYSHLLTSYEYGLVAWTISTAMLAFNLGIAWLGAAVLRLDQGAIDRIGFQTTAVLVFSALLLVLGAGLLATFAFIRDEGTRWLLVLGFLFLALTGWTEFGLSFLTARFRVGLYSALNLLRAILCALFGVLFVYFGWGATGALTGMILGVLGPSLWLLATNWRSFAPRAFDFAAFRGLCRYGLPLAVGYALYGITRSADRQILLALEGPAVVGLYAIGFDLAEKTIWTLMSPIGTAGLPLAVHALEKKGHSAATQQLSNNCILLAAVGLPTATGVALLAPDLTGLLLGEEFRLAATQLIPVLAAATFLRGVRSFYIDQAFHLGKQTSRLAIVMLVVASIGMGFNLVLIPMLGAAGAAYAALCAHAAGLVVGFLLGRRAFALAVPCADIVRIIGCTLIMAVVLLLVDGHGVLRLVSTIALGIAAYGAACVALDVLGIRRAVTSRIRVFVR